MPDDGWARRSLNRWLQDNYDLHASPGQRKPYEEIIMSEDMTEVVELTITIGEAKHDGAIQSGVIVEDTEIEQLKENVGFEIRDHIWNKYGIEL